MVNITRNPKRYDIELRRRPIVSTANYDFRPVQLKRSLQRTQHAWRPLGVMNVASSASRALPHSPRSPT
jgi:hypothetical protein